MRRAADFGLFHSNTQKNSHSILNGLLDTDRAAALENHQPSDKLPAEWVLLKLAKENESLSEITNRFRQELEEMRRPKVNHDLNLDDLQLSFAALNIPTKRPDPKLQSIIKALINSIDTTRDINFDILKKVSSLYQSYFLQTYPDPKTRNAKLILDQIEEALPLPAAHYFLAVLYQEGVIVEHKNNIFAIEHYLNCLAVERTNELEGDIPFFSSACEDALLVLRKECGITNISQNINLIDKVRDQRYVWELARWCKHPAALKQVILIGTDLMTGINPDLAKVQNCFAAAYYFSTSPVSTPNGYRLEKCFLRTTDISLHEWKQLLETVHNQAKLKLIELILSADISIAFDSLITLVQPMNVWSETQNIFMWFLLHRDFDHVIELVQTEKKKLIELKVYYSMVQAILQYINTFALSASAKSIRDDFISEATQPDLPFQIDTKSTVLKFDTIIVMIWLDISEDNNYLQMLGFKQFKDFFEKILAMIPDAKETYNGMKQLRLERSRGKTATNSVENEEVKMPVSLS